MGFLKQISLTLVALKLFIVTTATKVNHINVLLPYLPYSPDC